MPSALDLLGCVATVLGSPPLRTALLFVVPSLGTGHEIWGFLVIRVSDGCRHRCVEHHLGYPGVGALFLPRSGLVRLVVASVVGHCGSGLWFVGCLMAVSLVRSAGGLRRDPMILGRLADSVWGSPDSGLSCFIFPLSFS